MSVSPARRIAFEVLLRVERDRAYAADLLHARLDAGVKREDAALATELTYGALRWQRLLDFLIERQSRRGVDRLDLEVLVSLRLGFYQLRFLTRVPVSAAVNESVELAKLSGKGSAAGLVNAVLRQAPGEPIEKLLPANLPPAERLAILHSHPTWLVERWLKRFSESRTVALLQSNNRQPRQTVAVCGANDVREVAAGLDAAGLEVSPGRWLSQALVVSGGRLADAAPFQQGDVQIQDEASQMVALLLDVAAGNSVLDLCAAPGGKTIALARSAGPGGRVVACDLHLHRLRTMRATAAVHRVALDATTSLPFGAEFDRVLVDAPCSGTGTLARNPEIRWRLGPEDLTDFHSRQVAMLSNGLDRLRPGGRLVYSTCSLEPEENEDVVAAATESHPGVRIVSPAAALAAHLMEGRKPNALIGGDNVFHTWPPEHGVDGFYAVGLEKEES